MCPLLDATFNIERHRKNTMRNPAHPLAHPFGIWHDDKQFPNEG